MALMSSRFGRPLLQQIKYVDSDGTVITVSAEEEWKAVLASGIQALEGAEAGTEPAEVDGVGGSAATLCPGEGGRARHGANGFKSG